MDVSRRLGCPFSSGAEQRVINRKTTHHSSLIVFDICPPQTVALSRVPSMDLIPNALVTVYDDRGFNVQIRTDAGGKAAVDLPATAVVGQDGQEQYRLYTFAVSAPNFKQLIEQDIPVVPNDTTFLDLPMMRGEGNWLRRNPRPKDHPGIRFLP